MQIPEAFNIEPFAEYTETIRMLYLADDDFKSLCDDYIISKLNMEKYRGQSRENVRSVMEYQQLAQDLEKEILEYIRKIS
jgi:hypothetical protein